ncbi:MAG: hypothetical protein KKA64_01275 [Nanoarchaeota archaeon]|nr:hypothetical protein [Nanoarchaeota archaeon]
MALLTNPWAWAMIALFTWIFDMALKETIEDLVKAYSDQSGLLRMTYFSIPLLAAIILGIIDYQNSKKD